MDVLRGFAWLLLCQSVGELLAKALGLGLPGPVLGMLLMLPALNFELVRGPVEAAANALLAHLSLLFVPVGVGVMTHLSLLSQYGVRLAVVVVLSTLLGIAATAVLLRHLWRRAA
ncbi:MAG TPA: CidA/LrgA family protein [Rubrivivax sp.]|nr:CidA/LrgA family protein [Rubrivivax sp.]